MRQRINIYFVFVFLPGQSFKLQTHERSIYRSAPTAQATGELGLAIVRVPEGIIVSEKKTGSPAAYSQRLRVGDKIIKVDNMVVGTMDVSRVRTLLAGPPYTSVELELIAQDSGAMYSCALQRSEGTGWSSRDATPYRNIPEPPGWDSVREVAAHGKKGVCGDSVSVHSGSSQYGGDASSAWNNGGGSFPSFDLTLDIFNAREGVSSVTGTRQHTPTQVVQVQRVSSVPGRHPRTHELASPVVLRSNVLTTFTNDPLSRAGQVAVPLLSTSPHEGTKSFDR